MDNGMAYHLSGIMYNKGFDIDGFEIKNILEKKLVNITELEELIQNGSVVGCDILTDDSGKKYVDYTDGDLKDLPLVFNDNKLGKNEFKAVAVLVKSDEPYGYRLEYKDGFVNYGLDVVWELARRGCISNIDARFEDDCKTLIGKNDTELWKLEAIVKS